MVWGRKSKKSQAEFHVYNQNGQKLKTVKALCAHKDRLNIQTVVVESTEYLAVACCRCRDINLYHLGKETAYPAFSSDYPGPICHGREGTLFAVNSCKNADKEFDVTEIVCKRMQFTYGQVFQTHLKKVPDVCYIPTRDILVLSTHKKPKYRDDLASDEDVSDDEREEERRRGSTGHTSCILQKRKRFCGRLKRWMVFHVWPMECSTSSSMTVLSWVTEALEGSLFSTQSQESACRVSTSGRTPAPYGIRICTEISLSSRTPSETKSGSLTIL